MLDDRLSGAVQKLQPDEIIGGDIGLNVPMQRHSGQNRGRPGYDGQIVSGQFDIAGYRHSQGILRCGRLVAPGKIGFNVAAD